MVEVDKTSTYVGAKTITKDGGNLYYNISTVKEDAEMLERYWREACSDVAAVAKEFLKSAETTDEDWTLTLEMPAKYKTGFNEVLKYRVFSYIVRAVLIRWLLLCGFSANMIKVFQEEAHGILIGIEDILYTRSMTRAADGVPGDNSYGIGEAPDFGEDEDEEKTGDNSYGIGEAPDFGEDEDEEKTGDNSYGEDMRQNIGPTNAIFIGVMK